MEDLIEKIQAEIKKAPLGYGAYDDLFSVCKEIEPSNFTLAHDTNKWLKRRIGWAIGKADNVSDFFHLYKRSLLFEAVYEFDSYMLYLEINRPPAQRFYQPRRRIMKRLVDAIQQLADDELDELEDAAASRQDYYPHVPYNVAYRTRQRAYQPVFGVFGRYHYRAVQRCSGSHTGPVHLSVEGCIPRGDRGSD